MRYVWTSWLGMVCVRGEDLRRLRRVSGVLITRRSQVQILPPLPTTQQVRGPFPLGKGLLHVWPVTKTATGASQPFRSVSLTGRMVTGRDI